jgi:hypothetical protein
VRTQLARSVARPPFPLQANEAAASGDAPPPIKAGPFGIPIPSLDGTADGTGGVQYGAQLTFAKRFSEVRAPVYSSLSLRLPVHMLGSPPQYGPRQIRKRST